MQLSKKKSSKSLSSENQSLLSKQTNSHSSLIMMGCLTFTTISCQGIFIRLQNFPPISSWTKDGSTGFSRSWFSMFLLFSSQCTSTSLQRLSDQRLASALWQIECFSKVISFANVYYLFPSQASVLAIIISSNCESLQLVSEYEVENGAILFKTWTLCNK